MDYPKKKIKCEIYRDSMQNYKRYAIPKAQLIIADVPYNVGYRLFINPQIGEAFEITLGKCANTKREIKPETNILHLLLSGEFDTDECKVVEEVF